MKKILAVVLALVLALAMGVTALADDHYDGYAGGYFEDVDDEYYMDWVWDVFETSKKAYCRIAVDFRYDEDIDIYVCPECVGAQLLAAGEWKKFNGWDWDKDSFEVYGEGPFTYEWDEVTLTDSNIQDMVETPYQFLFNGAYYDIYVNEAADAYYIYAKLADHNYKMFYKISEDLTDLDIIEATVKPLYSAEDLTAATLIADAGDTAFKATIVGDQYATAFAFVDAAAIAAWREAWVLGDTVLDPKDAADKLVIADLDFFTYFYASFAHDFYRITINPVDDYGTKVVRGNIYFKMVDYASGWTAKFTSAPLYIDFFHVDVFDKDVDSVAGEKKALILDYGTPYDNSFDCGKHDHEGGYTVSLACLVDGLYDYDACYWNNDIPDMISEENFDEGVGKSLKITDLDETYELQLAKVAEYQPSVNFTFDEKVATVVDEAFPDASFQALNFLTPNDGIIYKTASKLYIKADAKALGMKGEDTVYVYKYVGGVLEYQDAQEVNFYKGDQSVFVELAAGESLGSYYLSDTDLRAAEVEENPNTGANDVVGVAVALAVVSLVAAAAVSLKK